MTTNNNSENNQKLHLQQIAEKRNGLQVITLSNGTDYIIGKMKIKDMFDFAHENHLRINMLLKDESKSGEWTLLPYYTFSPLKIELLIDQYFPNRYVEIDDSYGYEYVSKRFIDHKVSSGASPIEIEKAFEETKSISRMFNEKQLGYIAPLSLVMDTDYTEHFIVSKSETLLSFQHITLAVALSPVTEDMTQLAIKLMCSDKKIPSLMGMMPEDIAKAVDRDMKMRYGLMESELEHFMGPFIIFSEYGELGYGYRGSKDGETWFWVGGDHSATASISDRKYSEINRTTYLFDVSKDHDFPMWMPVSQFDCDEDQMGYIMMPTE